MGERYLITGVQLSMLHILKTEEEREKLVDEILDKQYVGKTNNTNIEKDAKRIAELF